MAICYKAMLLYFISQYHSQTFLLNYFNKGFYKSGSHHSNLFF